MVNSNYLTYFQTLNYNKKHDIYYSDHFFKKRKKNEIIRYLLKAVIVCYTKIAGFDNKNYYKRGKLANFWLDTISKIKCKILVIMSYISSKLKLKKIEMAQKNLK